MAVAFWSIELKKGQKEEVQPPEGYVLNLQLAALGSSGNAIVKIHTQSIEGEELNSVLCTLREKSCDQFTMNLVFGYDVPTSFSYTGEAKSVFLSGYFQPGPEDSEDEEDYDEDDMYGPGEDEDDSEDDEDDEELTARSKERLNQLVAEKKLEIGNADDDDDESSSDEEDEEEEKIDAAFVKKMQAAAAAKKPPAKASKFAEPAVESSEEDSEDESSSDEEEAPPMKAQKTGSKGTVTPAGKAKQSSSKPNTPATGNKGGKTPQTGGNSNKKRKH